MEEKEYTFWLTESDGGEYSYKRKESTLTEGERQILVAEAMEKFVNLPEEQKVQFLHGVLLKIDEWYPE